MTEAFKQELVQRITKNLLDVQILRFTQSQPMWGYKIKKEVELRLGVKLRHGPLYPLLNSLEQNGFLTSQKQQMGGRTRKVYAITEKGNQYIGTYVAILKEQIRREDIEEKGENERGKQSYGETQAWKTRRTDKEAF